MNSRNIPNINSIYSTVPIGDCLSDCKKNVLLVCVVCGSTWIEQRAAPPVQLARVWGGRTSPCPPPHSGGPASIQIAWARMPPLVVPWVENVPTLSVCHRLSSYTVQYLLPCTLSKPECPYYQYPARECPHSPTKECSHNIVPERRSPAREWTNGPLASDHWPFSVLCKEESEVWVFSSKVTTTINVFFVTKKCKPSLNRKKFQYLCK